MHDDATSRKCSELQAGLNALFADITGHSCACTPKRKGQVVGRISSLKEEASKLFDMIFHLEQKEDALSDAAGKLCEQCKQGKLVVELLMRELEYKNNG